ncbi:S1 RNA-binding domain-containing protein [Actinoplanes sp. CA-252034]|uniref:S1 RNA-binding domain-containing protein n=1 Tax=Actinoplanes sp. CA-252034 TaxID=3239906 RepID=UPI003D98EA9E
MDDDRLLRAFMETVSVGDTLTGTVAEIRRSATAVLLDGFTERPVGIIGPLDLSWHFHRRSPDETLRAGDRVRAEVIAVDQPRRRILLSRAATENPLLWAFLKGLHAGRRLPGVVAAIERFGVFVDLDDGPKHPTFPGVGFITMPELSWRRFEDPAEVVSVGRRVTCEFLMFDTTNGEARLSLRATLPDPFLDFARAVRAGQVLPGTVTRLVPFGAFVRVGDDIEGLVHLDDLSPTPVEAPDQAVQVGDQVTVTVKEIDPTRRRLALSRHL